MRDRAHRRRDAARLLMLRNGFGADASELEVYKAMLAPVAAGLDRLYAMDGIRYAEPAPVFRLPAHEAR